MSSFLTNVPVPIDDAIARPKRAEFAKGPDPLEGKITRPWLDFFTSQGASISSSSQRVAGTGLLSAQSVSVGATDITNGALGAGTYRLSYYMSITQAAGVSSSIQITLDWTESGNAKSFAGAAVTSNVITGPTSYQEKTMFIRIDSAAPVRYAVVFSSVGAPVAQYGLDVTLESVAS